MILPSYLLSAMYLWQAGTKKSDVISDAKKKKSALFIGIAATLYCVWLIYAAGVSYLLMAMIFYAIGIPFYRLAHKDEVKAGRPIYKGYERFIEIAILILAAVAVYMIYTGAVSF